MRIRPIHDVGLTVRVPVAVALTISAASGCAFQAQVPSVDVSTLAQIGGKLPGRFAVEIGTTGLSLTAKRQGLECAAYTFPVDLTRTWELAMKTGLLATLAQVDFVGAAPPPSKPSTAGYDALLRVLPSSAESRFSSVNYRAESETEVRGRLGINFPDGRQREASIHGAGTAGGNSSYFCRTVDQVIAIAGAIAVKDAAERTMLATKQFLADRNSGAAVAATGAPFAPPPVQPATSIAPPSVTQPSREAYQVATRLTPRNEVKLTKRQGTYMVPVRINDAITLDFLLDTGADDVAVRQAKLARSSR
jgi:hypothetical protein